jgi:hypothetical protein
MGLWYLLHYLNFSYLDNYENELFELINSIKELARINEAFNNLVLKSLKCTNNVIYVYIFINILIHLSNPIKGLYSHFQWITQSINLLIIWIAT